MTQHSTPGSPTPGSPTGAAAPRTATASGTVTRLPQQRPPGPGAAVQGSLALSYSPVAAPPVPEGPTGVPADVRDETAEIRHLAGSLAQAAVEVVAGQRPVLQMLRWTDEHVYGDLERRAALVAQARGTAARRVHAQVRSVHVCRPHPEVAEVSVHVRHGERSRALALRLERHRDRWRCTVLLFG